MSAPGGTEPSGLRLSEPGPVPAPAVGTTEEAEQKRLSDARLQLVINEVAVAHATTSEPGVVEHEVVRAMARHGLVAPSEDWVIAVANAITHGKPYVLSPQSMQDAAELAAGRPPGGAVAAPPAPGRSQPAPAPPLPPGRPADTRALVVAGAALLVALWALRSRRR